MQSQYKSRVSRLQKEIDELRQQGTTADDNQSTSSAPSSSSSSAPSSSIPPPSQLRVYISRLERHEDRRIKDQLRLLRDFGRRLERIEDIGCSYFKPRSARCRMQDQLFRRLNKGQLHGVVKPDHLCQVATYQNHQSILTYAILNDMMY